MAQALSLAEAAAAAGEVPVGALVVKDGQLIASAHNQNLTLNDPSAHAEVLALRQAAQVLGNHRLEGCTLYVTLEPCAMCSGAILNARLGRLVFGASEPRTGAAGSVVDLFAHKQLNHHTQVEGGVLSQPCAQLLRDFFKPLRVNTSPLREDALRTPDSSFAQLPDYPWAPHYVSDLNSAQGLRLHHLDEGPADAEFTWLLLHDQPGWSYFFRHMIPVFLAQGHRVVAPDWIGFGKSDKPKKAGFHKVAQHRQILQDLLKRLNLHHPVLVLDGQNHWVQTALSQMPVGLFRGGLALKRSVQAAHVWTRPAYQAPFPDRGHRAAVQAFESWPQETSVWPTAQGPHWELELSGLAEPDEGMARLAVRHFVTDQA
jgi:tRNA(adenine34) deaminase